MRKSNKTLLNRVVRGQGEGLKYLDETCQKMLFLWLISRPGARLSGMAVLTVTVTGRLVNIDGADEVRTALQRPCQRQASGQADKPQINADDADEYDRRRI